MPQVIDILNHETVQKIIQDIESQTNINRKRNEWIAYQSTQGMLKDYVLARLETIYPKNYRKMRVTDISVSKKVVDKLSQAYCESPLRTLNSDSEDIKKEFDALYKEGHFNCVYQEIDEIFNLHRHGLFWTDYDYEEQSFRPIALRPFEYDLVRDQKTGKVICVILNYPDQNITRSIANVGAHFNATGSDGLNNLITESQYDSGVSSKVYALWTDTQHATVVVEKKKIDSGKTNYNYAITFVPVEGNPDGINPLGVLPFTYIQKGSSIDYPTFSPITEQTISYNVMKTDLMTSATMQGFGQAILKYPEGAEIREIEVGYMSAVRLPQSKEPGSPPTDFKFENANPDLEGQKTTYTSFLKEVLGEYGITLSDVVTGDSEKYSSGLDRLLAQSDLYKVIKKNQEIYSDLEEDVFGIIKAWMDLIGNNFLAQVEEISVYYPRPQVHTTDTDTINNLKTLLDLGLISKEDALMRLDPNLTKEAAGKKLEEILVEKQTIMQGLQDNQPIDNQGTGAPVDPNAQNQPVQDPNAASIYN